MTNMMIISIYLPVLIITIVTPLIAFLRNKKANAVNEFIFVCLILLFWHITHISFYLSKTRWISECLYNAQMIFIAYLPISLLFFVMRFYGMGKFLSRSFTVCISVIPILTGIFSFTNNYHRFVRLEFEVIQTMPNYLVTNIRGPWFWVHTAYCYIIILISGILAFKQMRKLPNIYRLPSYMLIFGLTITASCNVLRLFSIGNYNINFTAIGASISLLFLYMAIDTNEMPNAIVAARNEIFEALDDFMLILNTKEIIIDCNHSAAAWLEQFGGSLIGQPYDTLLEQIKSHQGMISKSTEEADSDGVDLILPSQDKLHSYSYRLKKRSLNDSKGNHLGFIIYISDITNMRNVLVKLEQLSMIDSLTGIHNRRSYDAKLLEYDCESCYPLGIIIGDVNGLKQVNDTYGHGEGDKLLQVISEALLVSSGENCFVARIGGDEFALLLKNTYPGEVEETIDKICNRLKALKTDRFTPSIALGYAIKSNQKEKIEKLIASADKAMYLNKDMQKTYLNEQYKKEMK